MKTFAAVAVTLACFVVFAAAMEEPCSELQAVSIAEMHKGGTAKATGIVTTDIHIQGNNAVIAKNNILFSKGDRVNLAKTIEHLVSSGQEAGEEEAAMTKNIIALVPGGGQNTLMMTQASNIIAAAKVGDTDTLAQRIAAFVKAAMPTKSDDASA